MLATHGGPRGEMTDDASTSAGPVMRAAFWYQRRADQLAEITGRLAQAVVIPTIIVGFVNVVLRYAGFLTGTQLVGGALFELQWYLYSLIFLFAFNYILKHQINVRVDFWFAHQPKRTKAWIDFIGHLVSLIPFCVIALWISIPQIMTSWRLQEQSPDPGGLPRYPIKTMIGVAFALLLIQAVAELIKLIAVLRGVVDEAALEEQEAPIRVE